MEIEELDDMDRQVEVILEDMVEIVNAMVEDLNKTINRIKAIRNRKYR